MDEQRYNDAGIAVGQSDAGVRARFITRTYAHLVGAIFAFTAIEVFLFQSGLAETISRAVLGTSWLLVLGGFLVVGWLASRTAATARSFPAQYAALAGYVVAEAIIFVPLLWLAQLHRPDILGPAVLVTLLGFTGLSGVVFMTRRDFSFLGGLLRFGFVVAILLIVAGALFGLHLGTFFSVGMIALAGGAVLYDTSNVLHHYPEDRYVSASLQLFASIALMFWYIVRLFMSRD